MVMDCQVQNNRGAGCDHQAPPFRTRYPDGLCREAGPEAQPHLTAGALGAPSHCGSVDQTSGHACANSRTGAKCEIGVQPSSQWTAVELLHRPINNHPECGNRNWCVNCLLRRAAEYTRVNGSYAIAIILEIASLAMTENRARRRLPYRIEQLIIIAQS